MKRVLVCEDEDLIRKGICKIVEGVCRDVQVHSSPRPPALPHGQGLAARTSWKAAG